MVKLFASEMAGRVADRCLQVFGGRGYMRENVAERFYRELRVERIWEGTSEIQRVIIAGQLIPRVGLLSTVIGYCVVTVVVATAGLVAQSVVARRGSGFFVAGAARPLTLSAADPAPEPAIDPSWINRHAMVGSPDFLCPGAGWLPDSWVLDLGVQRALRLAAREDPERRRQYDEPLGYAPLRRLFSVRLAERAVMADFDRQMESEIRNNFGQYSAQ